MPVTKSAAKALRRDQHKTIVNRPIRSKLKTAVDAVKAKPDASLLTNAFSAIDKAAKNRVIHKNKAARLKSKLSRLLSKTV